MIPIPGTYAWLSEAADGGCFTYVRGLTPEQVVVRLGGRPEDFTPMTLRELDRRGGSGRTRGDHGPDRVRLPPSIDPSKGPMFLMTERLTGITLTPQLLEESTYLWGTVPEPKSWMFPTPW